MVDIVIPVYRETPTEDDLIALKQAFKILNLHKITFVHPKSLNLSAYKKFEADFKGFDDFYFKDIFGYNQLMMSIDFYRSFSQKYILIYQTDCFVFKDELLFWCEKDYDYIGAPWIRKSTKVPHIKWFFDTGVAKIKSAVNFKGNRRWQKNKSLLYNAVGNGGLSLRKREKFIEILEKIPEVAKIYLDRKNSGRFYAEDVFFSIEPQRNNISFLKPPYMEACAFSIENRQTIAMKINNGKIPFGCHRWNKDRNFWQKIFKDYGVEI